MPLSPEEFLLEVLDLCMVFKRWVSVTSWFRSTSRNADKGGNPRSKHRIGMAMNLVFDPGITPQDIDNILRYVSARGKLWFKLYMPGDPQYPNGGLHVQGLPPGDIVQWWLDKYWREILPWDAA